MSWKKCGRKREWTSFKVLPRHLPRWTEEKPRENSVSITSPLRDMNPDILEYEAGVLTTRLQS
jgi:hypothetical protein